MISLRRAVITSSRSAVNPLISRKSSSRTQAHSAREFKVLLDSQTLYVGQELAEAMGWSDKIGVDGVKLSLHGLSPTFFSITPTGSDSEQLAQNTVQSGMDPDVKGVLEYLKDR